MFYGSATPHHAYKQLPLALHHSTHTHTHTHTQIQNREFRPVACGKEGNNNNNIYMVSDMKFMA